MSIIYFSGKREWRASERTLDPRLVRQDCHGVRNQSLLELAMERDLVSKPWYSDCRFKAGGCSCNRLHYTSLERWWWCFQRTRRGTNWLYFGQTNSKCKCFQDNYWITDSDNNDNTLTQDFGEFEVATVDIIKHDPECNCLNPSRIWYQELIQKNMIDLGFSGIKQTNPDFKLFSQVFLF